MSSRELACGKAAKRTKGFGAQSMTNVEMKKFIQEHGSEKAKMALKAISGVASRGQMCAIFHMFRRGREEISKGEGQGKLRLSPSPNRRISPVRSNGGSNSSSSEMNMKKMLNVFAFGEGRKKRQLKSILSAFKPKKNSHLMKKREHGFGPKVLMARPPKRASSSSNTNRGGNNRYSSNGSRSNRSYASNYGGSNVGNNIMKFANYQNLRAKRNKKVIKVKEASRFSKRNMFARVKAGEKRRARTPSPSSSSNRPRRLVKKNYPMMKFPQVAGGVLGTKPTRSVPYHRIGTGSKVSKLQLMKADEERWRKYEKLSKPNMSPNKKAMLANKLLQEAIVNVMGTSPVFKSRRAPVVRRNNGSASSSSSASPAQIRAKNVKARLMQKLRAMERRKGPPQVNVAKMFSKGIMSGRQQVNAVASRRQTKEERNALKNLKEKYARMMGNKNSSSSASSRNSSPVRKKNSPPKAKSKSGAMKSIRRP